MNADDYNFIYAADNGPRYTYYPDGKLCTRTWAREVGAGSACVTSNAYNIAGQLVSTTYSDGTPSITKQYNRLGQPIVVTQSTATDQRITTYDYDTNTFALLSESINGTNTISYTYNSRGQQVGSSVAEGLDLGNYLAVTQVTFDDYGRPATLQSIFGSETNTFHYNYLHGSAMVSSITNNLGFGISKYYEDNRNLIIGISNYFGNANVSSFEYVNDALGRRTERLDFDDNLLVKTNSFAYNQHQEIDEVIMGTNEYIFTYDDIGNRTEHLINDIYARYENNNDSLNRYSDTYSTDRVYNKGYDFDADGNMTNVIQYTTPWDTWQYTWNAENRITSARNTQYGIYVTYAYDYQGRMFEKVTNGVTNNFIWNGNHIISEMTDSTTNYYCWSNGETLCANLDGETVFYAHDANKNVTDLVDTSGDSVAHYEYSPFGVITEQSETLADDNPFRFSNEYFDATTGLVEYKFRPYIPPLGKFANRDPIGVQGGLNEYGIGGNDLINGVDWWGLSEDGMSIYVGFGSPIKNKKFDNVRMMIENIGTEYTGEKCEPKCKINVKNVISSTQLAQAILDCEHTFLYSHATIKRPYRLHNSRGQAITQGIPSDELRWAKTEVLLSDGHIDLANIIEQPEYEKILKENEKIKDKYSKKALPKIYTKAEKTFYPYVCYDGTILKGADTYLGIKCYGPI